MKTKSAVAVSAVMTVALLGGCGSKDDGNAATPAAPGATTVSAAPSTPAGNGVDALTGPEILAKAKAALTSAKSFHVAGAMTDKGEKMSLDFRVAGKEVYGTMNMEGAKVQLLSVDGQQFMKPDKAFWTLTAGKKEGAAAAEVIGDRWVKVDKKDASFASLFTLTDVSKLLDADGKVTKGDAKDVNGTPAIGLHDGPKDEGTLYVATVGEPYPLQLAGPTPADGALNFSEFGETFPQIKKPAAADVFDMAKLGN